MQYQNLKVLMFASLATSLFGRYPLVSLFTRTLRLLCDTTYSNPLLVESFFMVSTIQYNFFKPPACARWVYTVYIYMYVYTRNAVAA